MIKVVFICCVVCSLLFGQVLYEEYFTDGNMQLDWHPWFTDTLGIGDSMGVINDPSTPGGDSWAGRISNEYMGIAGLTYAGDSTLTDYSIDAWVYTVVVPGMGPYNGVAVRMDPATRYYYRLVSDFDSNARIRLGLIAGGGYPVALRDWTGAEIPGGAPASSSWHKFKLMVVADSIWCFYDDIELDGCPIINDSVSRGYFGVYTFNMSDTASTICDNIIVQEEGTGVWEHGATEMQPFAVFPNPFVDNVTIVLQLGSKQYVPRSENLRRDVGTLNSVEIYDVSGRLVRLWDDQTIGQSDQITWDGRDNSGRAVAPGVYLIRSAQGQSLIKVIKIN